MFSSSTHLFAAADTFLLHSTTLSVSVSQRLKTTPQKKVKLKAHDFTCCIHRGSTTTPPTPSSSSSFNISGRTAAALHKSIPFLAASIAMLLWSNNPADAGILSGFSGLESIPGPELPQIDFLSRFNEVNQKKYAEFDSRFKSSQILKELLEKSKLNKEKMLGLMEIPVSWNRLARYFRNKQEILDKYCIRGAEWGVGDCSTQGMTTEDRDDFISMLKKKAGTE